MAGSAGLKSPWSSDLSKVLPMKKAHMFNVYGEVYEADKHECFSLNDLAMHVASQYRKAPSTHDQAKNENLAKWVIGCVLNDVNLKTDKEVEGVRKLPPMVTSPIKRCDVTVFTNDEKKVLLQVEVQSSSMKQAVTKAIYCAADMIRFLRYSNKEFKNLIVFVLPKMSEKLSAMKITVLWENLHFNCFLKVITSVEEVCHELMIGVKENRKNVPQLPECLEKFPYLLPLSNDDLSLFQEVGREDLNPVQLSSAFHIMVDDGSSIHKLVFDETEWQALTMVEKARATQQIKHFIVPRSQLKLNNKYIFTYLKVPHGPLSPDNAHRFLRTFVEKVNEALTELHGVGLSHLDVRLPNICFDNEFNAVLIDVDRSEECNVYPGISSEMEGCMYQKPELLLQKDFTGERLDYIQLGWMVAWILDSSKITDYNERVWEKQCRAIQNDHFLNELVNKGTYNQSYLEDSMVVVDNEHGAFATIFDNPQ